MQYFKEMIDRVFVKNLLLKRLSDFDCVALLGPRQVGKTTLAREIAAEFKDSACYLDLERKSDRDQLKDPDAYFEAFADRLIVLDEIQRVPEIFQVLRVHIDARRRMGGRGGKFLLLGSASMELLRQSSESLAGRISLFELTPLTVSEALGESVPASESGAFYSSEPSTPESEIASPDTLTQSAIDSLWLRGGFPQSYLRSDDGESLQWRQDFIETYVERDVPAFGLQVATEKLDLFLRLLATKQGELFNGERFAGELGVSGNTTAKYLDLLEKLLLVRRLQPWAVNLGKRLVRSPRPYIRDSGLLHALLNLRTISELRGHPVSGKSWEGFAIEALINAARGKARPYFYRTQAGAEADLVLEFAPNRCWAIEIKRSPSATIGRGFHNAAQDLDAERSIVVHGGPEHGIMSRRGIEVMPLVAAHAQIRERAGLLA
jgi:uncharacterized protein